MLIVGRMLLGFGIGFTNQVLHAGRHSILFFVNNTHMTQVLGLHWSLLSPF
jgi:hypothetical protein